jgi:hypothetical protein
MVVAACQSQEFAADAVIREELLPGATIILERLGFEVEIVARRDQLVIVKVKWENVQGLCIGGVDSGPG